MAINAQQRTISEVFSRDRRYVIPDYQRPYVWKFDDAFQLIEDLKSAWWRGDKDFFLGSIVLMGEYGASTMDVIDGQQRLTTLSLLFAVLRDFTADEDRQNELTDLLKTTANSIRSVRSEPRVQLRNLDRVFFETYIIEDDLVGLRELVSADLASQGQRNIRDNVQAIIEALDEVLSSEDPWSFVRYVVTSVSLVVVETDGFESAHRIFGVLNTRGVPLTASDIFKSRVLGAVSEAHRDTYSEIWDQRIEPLSSGPDSFFQHLLVLATRSSVKRTLIEEFNERVLDRYLADNTAEQFIDEYLAPFARAYLQASEAGNDVSPQTDRILDLLRQYPSEEWMPVAMWVLTQPLSDVQRNDALSGLERVFGVYTAAGVSADQRSVRVVQLLRALQDAQSDARRGDTALANAFRIPDDIRQRAILRIKGSLPTSKVRKILLLRAHYAQLGALELPPRQLGIAQLVPSDAMPGVAPNVDREQWAGRLGTLALVRGESIKADRAGSWEHIRQRIVPQAGMSPSIVTDLSNIDELTSEALGTRHEEIVRLIARFWDIVHDSDGVDLPALTEGELVRSTVGGNSLARSRRILLSDVVARGLLSPGDELVWARPTKGDEFRVTVTGAGQLQLKNGTTVNSPTAACEAVAGSRAAALDVWKRSSDGQSLRSLWKTYARRFAR